jgi:hypothetical protein
LRDEIGEPDPQPVGAVRAVEYENGHAITTPKNTDW